MFGDIGGERPRRLQTDFLETTRLREITPPGTAARVHLTLTDEEPYAQAMVLIEAAPC